MSQTVRHLCQSTTERDMSDQTFHQIAAERGEEAAIRAGIAADPDTS